MNYGKPDIVIGADNGISGALVALSAHHGLVIDKTLMPTRQSGKSRECNGAEIVKWLHGFSFNRIAVCLETPSKHSPGLLALCSMWDCYGAIRGVLESCGIQHARIAPQTWQAALLGKVPKGGTKAAARAKAAQIWPKEEWLATPRSKKPHEGYVDAALIAEYYRRKFI
jgi:hypothetical protein